MDKQKADELIFSYIRKIFGFAMSKLSKIDEAEELASEITFQVYSSLLKQDRIENPDGYVFRIAQNVYAKHIDGKKLTASVDGIEYLPDSNDFTLDITDIESYGIHRIADDICLHIFCKIYDYANRSNICAALKQIYHNKYAPLGKNLMKSAKKIL